MESNDKQEAILDLREIEDGTVMPPLEGVATVYIHSDQLESFRANLPNTVVSWTETVLPTTDFKPQMTVEERFKPRTREGGEPISIATREGAIKALKLLAPHMKMGSSFSTILRSSEFVNIDWSQGGTEYGDLAERVRSVAIRTGNDSVYNAFAHKFETGVMKLADILGLSDKDTRVVGGGAMVTKHICFAGKDDLTLLANLGIEFEGAENYRTTQSKAR